MSLGLVLSGALVVGALSPAATAAPAEASPTVTTEKQTEIVVADTAIEARIAARSQGARVEVLSERSEHSSTFAEPDGSFTTESYTGIVRVADDNAEGGWRDVDLTLHAGIDGVIRPASGVYGLELHPGGSEDAPLVQLMDGDQSIGFGWEGDPLLEPTLDGSTATYRDVEPGVDLVVEATRYGFEHFLVLTEKPANPESVTVELPVVGDGLSLDEGAESVTVVDESGDVVASVGQAHRVPTRSTSYYVKRRF